MFETCQDPQSRYGLKPGCHDGNSSALATLNQNSLSQKGGGIFSSAVKGGPAAPRLRRKTKLKKLYRSTAAYLPTEASPARPRASR